MLVPPFILARNWDIFLDKDEMKRLQIGYNSLLCGRLITFRFSLGRPVWASISSDRLVTFARIKITNNKLTTGEAYLAFWMIRTGVRVNPASGVCKHLVKSLMGHAKYVSEDRRCLRVDYPSEPALAIGARVQMYGHEELLKYYESLENYVASRDIDRDRLSESISADICLQALDSAEAVKITNWNFDETLLPKICNKKQYILEDDKVESSSKFNVRMSEYFDGYYRIVTVESFVMRMFGSRLSPQTIKYLPDLLLTALISISYFNQMIGNFPFTDLKVAKRDFPSVDSAYSGDSCNVITNGLLMTGIMRECSYLWPPNYFGLDYLIPVCLKPIDSTTVLTRKKAMSRPEYSYIGFHVEKRNVGSISNVVAKCAVSNHLVRCALHANCKDENCDILIPDETYQKALVNGLVFVQVLNSVSIEQSRETPTITVELRNAPSSREKSIKTIKIMCFESIFNEIKDDTPICDLNV